MRSPEYRVSASRRTREAMCRQLNVALVPAPDQVVVRLTGDADLSTVPRGLRRPRPRPADLGTRQVVVDLAGAHFWDCSGLHALADFTGELAAGGRARAASSARSRPPAG